MGERFQKPEHTVRRATRAEVTPTHLTRRLPTRHRASHPRRLSAMSKKIVLINTSASTFAGGETGVWLEECATPYYLMKEAGLEIVIASPAGGPIPIDKGSMGEGFFTESGKKFLHDQEAMSLFGHSKKLDAINADDYAGMYTAGGHGCCADFGDNPTLKALIEKFYAAGKPVASDCHGPMCLAQCVKPDGTPLVAGLDVTGFSNAEEDMVGQTSNVPFLIETKFKEQGAKYTAGDPWSSHIAVAGKLATGQNPQSSEELAKAFIKLLA